MNYGTGKPLSEHCSYLRDDAERHRRILDAAERNSVIEGLPPLQQKTRQRILEQLKTDASRRQEPSE